MMPPKCTYCGREQAEYHDLDFDVIYFNPTAEDEAWHQRVNEEGLVGHPPNAFWFCIEHIDLAKKYESLHAEEALIKIRTRDQVPVNTDSYFESPKEAFIEISEMLVSENWEKLFTYYDLSTSNILPEEFLSGRFFIRTEAPEVAHPGEFWKFKHPFSPSFTFDYATTAGKIITVHLSIEIDQGGGMLQKGTDTFELILHTDKGYKILPPDVELDL